MSGRKILYRGHLLHSFDRRRQHQNRRAIRTYWYGRDDRYDGRDRFHWSDGFDGRCVLRQCWRSVLRGIDVQQRLRMRRRQLRFVRRSRATVLRFVYV